MTVGSFLNDVGSDLSKAGKVAGTVAQAVIPDVGTVLSGQAPQVLEERRQQATALQDAQVEEKANEIKTKLAQLRSGGGTALGMDQASFDQAQRQLTDQLFSLYGSSPKHAPKLMEALRQIVHPNGTVAGADAALPKTTPISPFPVGGTDQAGADIKAELEQKKLDAQAKAHKSVGKSPPVPGNQLPADAVGPNGEPIALSDRLANHSFVQWNGQYYPVAAPKPAYHVLHGRGQLIDPQTGALVKDLGPVNGLKFSTTTVYLPGDDGQMHALPKTTVSGPSGEQYEVSSNEQDAKVQAEAAQPSTGASAPTTKPPAPKGVARVLPKAAKPKVNPASSPAGRTLTGFSDLANRKLQTTKDRQVLESGKQIIAAVDNLLPLLEKRKNEGGAFDAAKQTLQFEAYKHGIMPSDPEQAKIFENAALLGVVGASIWSQIGRSKYTFEVIQQHLPKATDSPALLYDKVKWLKDHVVPEAQEAIKNPQPNAPSADEPIVVSAEDLK